MKKLNELYNNVESDVLVRGIKFKANEVKSGDLFFCLAKTNVDRYTQVDEAIKRLEGVKCGMRPSSCPNELANALKEYKNKKMSV